MGAIGAFFIGLLIVVVSVFMVLLILIQRGRGGGITGALGGAGGQSAFGSKAGDIFTRVTVVAFGVWIFLCMLLIVTNNRPPAKDVASDSLPAGTMRGIDDPADDAGAAEPLQDDAGTDSDVGTEGNVVAPGADQLILPDDSGSGNGATPAGEAGANDAAPSDNAEGDKAEEGPSLTGDEPPLTPEQPAPAEGAAPPAGDPPPAQGSTDGAASPPETPAAGGGQ